MNKYLLFGLSLFLLTAFLVGLNLPVQAAPVAQFTPFPTPTPGPDGRIIYIAVDGDSAWRIAAIFGFSGASYDELRALNKWGENPVIRPGDQILLGYGGPSDPVQTAGPTQTPAPILPTPSPQPGWGNLCIILYNDLNGDSLRQETEASIVGGAVNISNRAGTYSMTAETTGGLDYQCFKELPEGVYNISVAPPDKYNHTTKMNYTLELNAGDVHNLSFGAQLSSEATVDLPVTQGGGGRSPVLGLVGGLLLVAAVGTAVFAGRLIRVK